MIHKRNLKDKHVAYTDKDGKFRISRVVRIDGNYLTVRRASGVKERIYKDKVEGRQFRRRGLEPIQWG